MSEELEKEDIPQYVFHDMWNALYRSQRTKMNPNAKRRKKGVIATSCAIHCTDSNHQGEFNILASHSSPLVFNNTCWSWYEVAAFFLSCGARGYIGTLWAIDNQSAVLGARTFYDNASSDTVLGAIHKAIKAIAVAQSEDIYVYWGLHFTSLSPGHSAAASRDEVFRELLFSLGEWRTQIETSTSAEVKESATRALRSVLHELNTNFGLDDLKRMEQGIVDRDSSTTRAAGPHVVPMTARSSMDHPTEYQEDISSKPGET